MLDYIYEYAIILSIALLLFGLYCLYFLQIGGYKPALIIPVIGLILGVIGYCNKRKKLKNQDDNKTDDSEE